MTFLNSSRRGCSFRKQLHGVRVRKINRSEAFTFERTIGNQSAVVFLRGLFGLALLVVVYCMKVRRLLARSFVRLWSFRTPLSSFWPPK